MAMRVRDSHDIISDKCVSYQIEQSMIIFLLFCDSTEFRLAKRKRESVCFEIKWEFGHVLYFPPSEIYQLGLRLGPRQVPVKIRA